MPASGILKGAALSLVAYSLFSTQDMIVKLLVAHYPVPEILFVRSLIIMTIAMLVGGPHLLVSLLRSPNKPALLARGIIVLTAWLLYYSAARHLGLAEITTLYFGAPVIVVALSVVFLKERVTIIRWLAVIIGFCGVVLAANPRGVETPIFALMAVAAAACWACSIILVRLINRTETNASQIFITNAIFTVPCAIMLIWLWRTPDLWGITLMLSLGLVGGAGQFLLNEGFRHAPASVLAPTEYIGLVWAFSYGYAIWGDIPHARVFVGAALIMASSLVLIFFESRRERRMAAKARLILPR